MPTLCSRALSGHCRYTAAHGFPAAAATAPAFYPVHFITSCSACRAGGATHPLHSDGNQLNKHVGDEVVGCPLTAHHQHAITRAATNWHDGSFAAFTRFHPVPCPSHQKHNRLGWSQPPVMCDNNEEYNIWLLYFKQPLTIRSAPVSGFKTEIMHWMMWMPPKKTSGRLQAAGPCMLQDFKS